MVESNPRRRVAEQYSMQADDDDDDDAEGIDYRRGRDKLTKQAQQKRNPRKKTR